MYLCRPTDNLMRQTHLFNGLHKSVGEGLGRTRRGFLIILKEMYLLLSKKKLFLKSKRSSSFNI